VILSKCSRKNKSREKPGGSFQPEQVATFSRIGRQVSADWVAGLNRNIHSEPISRFNIVSLLSMQEI